MYPTDLLIAASYLTEDYPHLLKRLLLECSSVDELQRIQPTFLLEKHFSPAFLSGFVERRSELGAIMPVLAAQLSAAHVKIIQQGQDEYPQLLKQIHDPPPLLYCHGNVSILHNPTLAIVGTRKSSAYAQEVLRFLIPPMVAHGITIISGLAQGVDSLAHNITMETGGNTAAVLGSGIFSITPEQKRSIAERIIKGNGCILSEFAPHFSANQYSFPVRNRIIAGIASATLVIEADKKSGALITASCALENGREVLAVPGDIFRSVSRGTNQLLRQGGIPITCPDDILEAMSLPFEKKEAAPLPLLSAETPLSKTQTKILETLGTYALHVDDLIAQTLIPSNEMNALLAQMELSGYIQNIGQQHYRKSTVRS